jgi:ribulose kinase
VDTPFVTDVTAQGAALLAAVGAQVFRDEVEASRVTYRSGMRYEILPENNTFYDRAYRQEYQKNYLAHKPSQTRGA